MNTNDLTLGQISEIFNMFNKKDSAAIDNKMIGQYVIVRCRDAGVHAGFLESYSGRECVLTNSRRLWYWRPANKAKFLSGIANQGLDDSSKLSEEVTRIHLTENCEILSCSDLAEKSIRGVKTNAN